MSLALRSRAPFVLSRLQVPVQVALYAALFLVAQWAVVRFHLPLPANIVGMLMLLAMIVLRVLPIKWVKAGSRWLLAEMLLFFCSCRGRGSELRFAINGRRLANFCRDCGEYHTYAWFDRAGSGSGLSFRDLSTA